MHLLVGPIEFSGEKKMKIETQEYNEVTVVELQGEFTEEAE